MSEGTGERAGGSQRGAGLVAGTAWAESALCSEDWSRIDWVVPPGGVVTGAGGGPVPKAEQQDLLTDRVLGVRVGGPQGFGPEKGAVAKRA